MNQHEVPTTWSCGHCGTESAAADYCDSCGGCLGSAQQAGAADAVTCPTCGEPRAPGGEFCEVCGGSFTTGAGGAPPDQAPVASTPSAHAQTVWTAVVEADRAAFDANRAAAPETLTFPAGLSAREVPLNGDEIVIGRRNEVKGFFPDIDLSTPVSDPAVSRLHAVLSRQADGSWTLVDRGSANGTWINDATLPVEAMVPTPLRDGDRVHLGAFSVVRMRRNHEAGR